MKGRAAGITRFVFDKDRPSELNYYGIGPTPMFACQFDLRFSYCLYVPERYVEKQDQVWPLAVIVHGTDRPAQGYRDAFADWADANDCIILAPLFPAGITEPWELNSYKFIKAGDLRYDDVLLAMVDEVATAYNVDGDRFLIHGFSGGGHFAHRFLYLHPDRLLGCSIGAPGVVTLLDLEHDYWVGIRNLEEVFGIAPNVPAMREVAVQMVVGGDDTEEWEITITPGDRLWMEGADLAGGNRQNRMRLLKESFERQGIAVRHDVVPGVSHEGDKILPAVKDFFSETLSRR